MKQIIEDLNLKYEKLIGKNYNQDFSNTLQHFYSLACDASQSDKLYNLQDDFQMGQQAANKLKKSMESLFTSSLKCNSKIIESAFYSIPIFIITLLQSSRWQDNNVGVLIVIYYIELKQKLNLNEIGYLFKDLFISYLNSCEEIFQENTTKLLTLFVNQQNIYTTQDLLQIQSQLISSVDSSLQFLENNKNLLQVIQDSSTQNIGKSVLDQEVLDGCFDNQYTSSVQLNPYLILIKEIYEITHDYSFQEVLMKCCYVNQKKAQLQAFDMLSHLEKEYSEELINLIQSGLYSNNIDVKKEATILAKKIYQQSDEIKREEIIQKLQVFFALNQSLDAIMSNDIIKEFVEQQLKICGDRKFQLLKGNFLLIAHLSSIQLRHSNVEIRRWSWKNLYQWVQANSQQEQIGACIHQFLLLFYELAEQEKDVKTFGNSIYFLDKALQIYHNEEDQQLIGEILVKTFATFDQLSIQEKMIEILIKIAEGNQDYQNIIQALSQVTQIRINQLKQRNVLKNRPHIIKIIQDSIK